MVGKNKMKKEPFNIFTTLTIVLTGLIPFTVELILEEESSITGLFLLTAILILVIFYFIYMSVWRNIKKYLQQINNNNKKIKELEEKLKYKEDFYNLDKRLSIVEAKHGKRAN